MIPWGWSWRVTGLCLQVETGKLEEREELQTTRGQLASLQALQQSVLGEGDEAFTRWLEESAPRLLERLEVESRWQ